MLVVVPTEIGSYLPGPNFSHIRRSMQQSCATPVHWRRNVLIKNPNHIRVSNSEHDTIQNHGIADAESADIGFGQGSF